MSILQHNDFLIQFNRLFLKKKSIKKDPLYSIIIHFRFQYNGLFFVQKIHQSCLIFVNNDSTFYKFFQN